jgi:hypothetical protein
MSTQFCRIANGLQTFTTGIPSLSQRRMDDCPIGLDSFSWDKRHPHGAPVYGLRNPPRLWFIFEPSCSLV